MSRNLRLAALAALALVLSAGCGSKWNSPAIPQLHVNDILPLAVGNQWTYVDSTFAATGQFQSLDSSRVVVSARTTLRIAGVDFDTYDWTWVDPVSGAPDSVSLVVGTAPNGTYSYGGRSRTGLYSNGRFLTMRYPVYLNDSWPDHEVFYAKIRGFIDSTYAYQCTAPNTQFHRSPTESMTAVEYYANNFFFYPSDPNHSHHAETFLYQVPGVGYVGFVYKLDGIVTHSRRLRSYVLMPPTPPGTTLPLPAPRAAGSAMTATLWGTTP